jgi:outer membrane lipoprotein-sorting protein
MAAKINFSRFQIQGSRFKVPWIPVFLTLFLQTSLFASGTNTLLNSWFAAQTNFQTWSADFVQTRTLKSLSEPLVASGHLSFNAPNRFRWEIIHPSPTIAVRAASELLVIYPRLKRAERYPLTGTAAGPWRDTLALLEAGFPRTQADLESRFRIQSQTVTNEVCELALQPKSSSARRMMPLLKIVFATNDFSLRATELQFADGSTMRNDFTNSIFNPKLNESLFAPTLESDFKIVEPAMGAR